MPSQCSSKLIFLSSNFLNNENFWENTQETHIFVPSGEGNEEVEIGVGGRPVCHHTPLFLFNHLCACVTYSKITRILLLTLRFVKFWLGSFSSPSGVYPYSALLSLIITSTTSTCRPPFTWCCSWCLPLIISFSPLASQ